MRVRGAALLCSLLLSAPGCSCSQRATPGGEIDAGDAPAGDDAGARDGARLDAGVDALAPWDAGTCLEEAYWQREPRTITSVSLLDGPPPHWGATERLLVEVQLTSACDVLAGIENVGYSGDATDFVQLRAEAWTLSISCAPSAPVVTALYTIPGRSQGNLRVVVTDESSPGGGLRLTYDRAAVTQAACEPATPPGSVAHGGACLTDCDCAAGLSCIGYYGLAGEAWSCLRPCADSRECGAEEHCPEVVMDAPAYVCYPGDQCATGDDCPPGFACVAGDDARVCQDQRGWPAVTDCACDDECPPGQHCTLGFRDWPTCEVWCQRDTDCPNPEVQVFVCGTPGFCVPLE